MIDLSIIIPIYNTPVDALARCFASIASSEPISFEVLLIDDGSCSETASFCDQYAATHPNFLCFHKENGGVSSARNYGIAQAKGTYITFLDADDCLIFSAFQSQLLEQDLDLVLFDMQVCQSGTQSIWKGLELPEGSVSQLDVLRRYITSHTLNGPVAKLFKTQTLRKLHLQFDESFVTAEDWMFGCNFVLGCDKIHYVSTPSYLYYRDGGNSVSRLSRFPDTLMANLVGMYEKKLEIIDTLFPLERDHVSLKAYAASSITEALFNCYADLLLLKLQTPERKHKITQVCSQASKLLQTNASKKTRIKSWMLLQFPVGIYPIALLRSLYLKLK